MYIELFNCFKKFIHKVLSFFYLAKLLRRAFFCDFHQSSLLFPRLVQSLVFFTDCTKQAVAAVVAKEPTINPRVNFFIIFHLIYLSYLYYE